GGGMREATTTVESGRYAGRAALILVTAGSFCCERRGTATSRLYLDPDTCLPLALESDGQLEFDVSGPGGGRREVRPTRTRADYAHEFLPAYAVPADFFDPAAIG